MHVCIGNFLSVFGHRDGSAPDWNSYRLTPTIRTSPTAISQNQVASAAVSAVSKFMKPCPPFLLSMDLEDIRQSVPDGNRYADRVEENTGKYLGFFKEFGLRCTVFVVGDVAARYPDLVRRVAAAGHEIAWHGSDHTTLDRMDERSFQKDLDDTLQALSRAGVSGVRGYRAPMLSLTDKTPWAHAVLKRAGFAYSSSVLPAKNLLHGWPGFGRQARRVDSGLWEIPVSLTDVGVCDVPFMGGVYFRAAPLWLLKVFFKRTMSRGDPVVGYLHPYDIDTKQERFMHDGIGESRLLNELMYYNRKSVFPKLKALLSRGEVMTYSEYVGRLDAGGTAA
jgi:polysaccharide deacetylase family protein (PEP-CTERM system associated)